MKMHLALASAALVAVAAATPASALTTVNFDQSTDTDSYAAQGLVLNGFTITNNTFGGAVNVPSAPNYASVNLGGGTLSFVDANGAATTSNGFGLTIPGLNLGGGYYAGATLTFLNAAGLVLGTQTFAAVGPQEFRSPVTYANALAGISSVTFTRLENPAGSALFPIDNVSFTLNAGAVPEPAGWALMIGGIGIAGGALRRRRTSPTLRFA